LAPLAAVPLSGVCLINQDGAVDPWLYTGYGRMLKSLVGIGGWTYYSLRFPVISLISLFSTVFREPLDFVLLRHATYLIVAFVLYRFNSKIFGKGAAVAALATLLAAPQFGRISALCDATQGPGTSNGRGFRTVCPVYPAFPTRWFVAATCLDQCSREV
jgi:hypothetical protein